MDLRFVWREKRTKIDESEGITTCNVEKIKILQVLVRSSTMLENKLVTNMEWVDVPIEEDE